MSWDHKQSTKEVIKHLLFKLGAHDVLNIYRNRRGFVTKHLEARGPAERFSEIYKHGAWVHVDGQHSKSGVGSEAASTDNLVAELPEILQELGCGCLLDLGCGDWNWMSNVQLSCDYIGVDIVPEVIAANRRHERQGVRFLLANASVDPLPEADVVLCREVLFHLSFKDATAALQNIQKSADWLIATTDTSIWFNSDIPTGDFRNINLQRAPFSFPPLTRTIVDEAVSPGRILGVWNTKDLPV